MGRTMHALVGEVEEQVFATWGGVDDLLCAFREEVRGVLTDSLPRSPSAVGAAVGGAGIVHVHAPIVRLVREVVFATSQVSEVRLETTEGGGVRPGVHAHVPFANGVRVPVATKSLRKQRFVQKQAVRLLGLEHP